MTERLRMIMVTFLMFGAALALNMVGPMVGPKPAIAGGADPFLGEIDLVPYTYAPAGWAFCEGQILPINQNSALFALIGTTYGGNGQTTFALPDLRGRVPMGVGQGPNLSNYILGQTGGTESVTLTNNNIPMHTNVINATTSPGTTATPGSNENLAQPTTPDRQEIDIYASNPVNTSLAPNSVGSSSGGSQPISIQQPYLGLHYIIALQGIFPSRP
ncbi:MAG: tail fiber protein [Desulfosporosinus sp.]|nr:tail fiber protein [Desulfosporosinus sp.]